MKIFKINPRGFCAGVDRAIKIVDLALSKFKSPIYVKHEIVHNQYIVNDFKARGVIFVEDIKKEVPKESVLIFSAHGVSKANEDIAKSLNCTIIDATCPLVKNVHQAVQDYGKKNYEIILIGHKNHVEIEGTRGRVEKYSHIVESVEDVLNLNIAANTEIAYATQTTLSIDETQDIVAALKNRFPNIMNKKDSNICYATQNRQDAIKKAIDLVDVFLIMGDSQSSNSNRLKDVCEKHNRSAYLLLDPENVDLHWFNGKRNIGISAGASCPEILLDNMIEYLKNNLDIQEIVNLDGVKEDIVFHLPKILREV